MENKTLASRARERNWLKARITGMILALNADATTEEERTILRDINILRMQLLDNWDENSKKLGMKLKPRKESI